MRDLIDFLKRLHADVCAITANDSVIVRIDYDMKQPGGNPQLLMFVDHIYFPVLLEASDAFDEKLHAFCINHLKSEMARLAIEPAELEPHDCKQTH